MLKNIKPDSKWAPKFGTLCHFIKGIVKGYLLWMWEQSGLDTLVADGERRSAEIKS